MSTRQEKIQGLLKTEISDILLKEFGNPRLGFVTITDAEVSPDLRHAKIFVSVLGSEDDRRANMKILKNAQGFIRQALSRRMHMKTLPNIEFRLDTTIDKVVRMMELLDEVKNDDEELS